MIEYVSDRPGHDRRYAIKLDTIEKGFGLGADCFI